MKLVKFAKVFFFVVLPITLIWGLKAQDTPKSKSPKEIFIGAKCNTCHSVSAWEIEQKNKSANNKAPDLSKVELKETKDFYTKYLLKEETLNDKKHPVRFKGNDEELEEIVNALLTLTNPIKEDQKGDKEEGKQEQK